jgi:hypothetical protein
MKTITVLVGLVLTALPAVAQSKVYTNRDLTPTSVTWTRTVTPEELAGLKAREYVYVPKRPVEARVVRLPNRPLFEPFEPVGRPSTNHRRPPPFNVRQCIS